MGIGGLDSNRGISGPEIEGIVGLAPTGIGAGEPAVDDGAARAQFDMLRMAASSQAGQLAQMARLLEAEEMQSAPVQQSSAVANAGTGTVRFSELDMKWNELRGAAEHNKAPFPTTQMKQFVLKDGVVTKEELAWAEKNIAKAEIFGLGGEATRLYRDLKKAYDKQEFGTAGALETKYDQWTADGKLSKDDIKKLTNLAKADGVSADELAWAKAKAEEAKGTPNEKMAAKLYADLKKAAG